MHIVLQIKRRHTQLQSSKLSLFLVFLLVQHLRFQLCFHLFLPHYSILLRHLFLHLLCFSSSLYSFFSLFSPLFFFLLSFFLLPSAVVFPPSSFPSPFFSLFPFFTNPAVLATTTFTIKSTISSTTCSAVVADVA